MNPRFLSLALIPALAISLAACQSTPAGASSGNATSGPSEHVITGTATYLERMKVPPGASFHVQLIDSQLADTPKAVLSEITMKDVAGAPYHFTLPYDPKTLRKGGMYGLHASLNGPNGELWFVTDTRVPVDPASSAPVEFRMVRVPGPGETQANAAANVTHWSCGDLHVGATFDNAADRVVLAFAGRSLPLLHAMAASGARYADGSGNEFWTKGDAGVLTLAGEKKRDCTQADSAR
ncbi:YbaY family lipoprotein [Lysobacter niastensis]|uniref:YbaY family lipoprotein n=1 Tax=Lysobacter niastensis TaxID=380629 RepID=A0ABS0BC05_9GAMM|nr:YbaY family lipoprotein [Lysobacter niastensis]MBF6024660.1 YbaY family lipoprotein [Lysobacter niastensis]